MIQYRDWYIWTQGQVVARQFDHMTRSLEVIGELPEGWEWTAIVRVGDYMDYLPLTLTQTGAAITLSAQQLSLAGMYSIQLRGKQGEQVRHTNVLSVYVPASLSGDKQWPTIPSEFTELERRITQKAAQVEGYSTHCPIIGNNGNWWEWDGTAYKDTGKPSISEGVYELVEEITTTEELTSVVRTAWPDGTPYNFKAAKVKLVVPPGAGYGLVVTNYWNDESFPMARLATSPVRAVSSAGVRYQWSRAWREHGMWEGELVDASSSAYTAVVCKMAGQKEMISDLNITRIEIAATTSGIPLPAGTNIKIYGVRA